jgi:putative aminopeptidase FrvX
MGDHKLKWFISAHMDTCGFLVHSIANGLVKCLNFGYQDAKACHLQPVAISTKNGYTKGLMHAKQEDKGKPKFEIDIGTSSSEEVKKLGIKAGDPVHFSINPFLVGNPSQRIICSPRLDNRIGIFELLLLAKNLKEDPPSDDVFLVATVEEEVGARGAKTAAQKIEPDLALILDITYDEHPVSMGQGPVITLSDRSSLLSTYVRDYLMELAKDNKIPIQTEVWNIGGTDAGPVRVIGAGIPTIPVLTATKNNHTPIEMACVDDCYSVVKFCQLILDKSKEIQTVFQQ